MARSVISSKAGAVSPDDWVLMERTLKEAVGLREVPSIRFQFDDSLEKGARVEELLRKLRDGEPVEDEAGDNRAGDEPGDGEGGEEDLT